MSSENTSFNDAETGAEARDRIIAKVNPSQVFRTQDGTTVIGADLIEQMKKATKVNGKDV